MFVRDGGDGARERSLSLSLLDCGGNEGVLVEVLLSILFALDIVVVAIVVGTLPIFIVVSAFLFDEAEADEADDADTAIGVDTIGVDAINAVCFFVGLKVGVVFLPTI